MKRAAALVLCLTGCVSATPRFADAPVIWQVDDRRDVPDAPREIDYFSYPYMADVFLLRRSTRALELRDEVPAQNTNALDEVPDSTWFTNRIGRKAISAAQAVTGPDVIGPPVLPLVVKGGKEGGGNPGFIAADARGELYLIKFDTIENPEMQTATDAIVSRLFWLVGYNVPADHVFYFKRDQIRVGRDTKIKNELLEKRPMTEADLDAIFTRVPVAERGQYRALASTFLKGKPLGGAPPEGVREDDPNDRIPHEHRRELRGLRVFAAWLNHTDMKQDNTLDMYVQDGERHYVMHYLLDFGEAFAGHAAEKARYEDGFENFWDWRAQTLGLLSLGLWKRPWEDAQDSPWLSVGSFSASNFDPKTWREAYPYWPFTEATDEDNYWATKILMRVSPALIEAVIETGQLSHRGAEERLLEVLLERQRRIGLTYFGAVTPLDDFEIIHDKLCGVDQMIHHRLVFGASVDVLDKQDNVISRAAVAEDGQVCVDLPAGFGYHVMRLRSRRGHKLSPPMQVHLRIGDNPAVLGIVRLEDH